MLFSSGQMDEDNEPVEEDEIGVETVDDDVDVNDGDVDDGTADKEESEKVENDVGKEGSFSQIDSVYKCFKIIKFIKIIYSLYHFADLLSHKPAPPSNAAWLSRYHARKSSLLKTLFITRNER